MFRLLAAAWLLAGTALAADPAAEAGRAYTVEASASPSAVKVGEEGKLAVTIRPASAGWHVHPQAPLKVRFEAPAGLKLGRAELGRKDAVEAGAESPRFETSFVASAAGRHDARASVDFFICSDAACVKQVKAVTIPVTVR